LYTVSQQDSKRINALIFRTLRMHCFDYQRTLLKQELCNITGCRSFKSMRIISETFQLHQLCTEVLSTPLTVRLMEQSYTLNRMPNRVFFFDYRMHRIGRTSFVNWAKFISKLILFDGMQCLRQFFKFKMKQVTPCLVR